MTTLVVRNVPKKIGTYAIKNMCRSHGVVEKVQKQNGEIMIAMPQREEALLALASMRDRELLGHKISVTIDK